MIFLSVAGILLFLSAFCKALAPMIMMSAPVLYALARWTEGLGDTLPWFAFYAIYLGLQEIRTQRTARPGLWQILIALVLGVSAVLVASSWAVAQIWGGAGQELIKNMGPVLEALVKFLQALRST